MNAEQEKAGRDFVAYIGQPMPDEMRAGHIKGIGNYLFAEGGAALAARSLGKSADARGGYGAVQRHWRRE